MRHLLLGFALGVVCSVAALIAYIGPDIFREEACFLIGAHGAGCIAWGGS